MSKALDLTGKKFNQLTVIKRIGPNPHKKILWLCLCQCGNFSTVVASKIVSGYTKSCGCLHEKAIADFHKNNLKHGQARKGKASNTYKIWGGIVYRCTNPNSSSYKNYMGRGITVCDEWRNSYEAFLADMGERPPGLTVERIDNNLGYSKENCKWATPAEQARNKRTPEQVRQDKVRYNL